MSTFTDQIRAFLLGRHPLLLLQTPEEDRVRETLEALLPEFAPGGRLTTWTCVDGLQPAAGQGDTRNPLAALRAVSAAPHPGFYLFKDLPAFMDQPEVLRALRDVYHQFLAGGQTSVVLVAPQAVVPPALEKELCFVEVELPTPEELLAAALRVQAQYPGLALPAARHAEIALGLRGLTLNEATHVMHRVFRGGNLTGDTIMAEIFAEKKMLVRKAGYLEFVPSRFTLADVGGLENVKDWAAKRASLFNQDAVSQGLPVPRGVLIMGISGCGKSLLCKVIANLWHVPLFRLDMNLVFSGIYGSPEAAFHRALKTVEAVAPAVLWIDEIESGLGMMHTEGGTDQSLTFSAFLTWMQEKPPLVFVAATANRIESLPAEVIRKGRFDQVFFCDLPDEGERTQIINIHLRRQGLDPATVEIGRLLPATEGWSGAELEQAIVAARIDAHQEGRPLTTDDVKRHTASMVPLSQTMSEQIKAIRRWAFDRATLASKAKRIY